MSGGEDFDDAGLALQVQQFFDEWHYRLLASYMADNWDRQQGVLKAIELFEVCGTVLSQEEKNQLVNMEESAMIWELVQKMPLGLKKTIGHFLLQVQLVLSTTTRVRGVLDEGSEEEVAKVMEDGDLGISQNILKQAVIEASAEIGEINKVKHGWESCMKDRVGRLSRCAEEADAAATELRKVQVALDSFGKDQNSKSKSVLNNLSSGQEGTFIKTIFMAWSGWLIKFKSEKDIHDKFRKQIKDLEKAFMDYKEANLSNVRSVLMKNAAAGDGALLTEVVRMWKGEVDLSKERAGEADALAAAEGRLSGMKAQQKDNAKKSLLKMTAGTENALLDLTQEAWHNFVVMEKKTREENEKLEETQKKLAEFKASKGEQATSVIQRFQAGSEMGVVTACWAVWAEEWKSAKKSAELDQAMKASNDRFAMLNGRQKGAANSLASSCGDLGEENDLVQIFLNWATEAKVERIYAHYSGRLEGKKQKMEAVQGMFKRFADQLEQGIQSPRSQRKGAAKQ